VRCHVDVAYRVVGFEGDDDIELSSTAELGRVASIAQGGPGDDAITDGPGGVLILGETGDDEVRAGAGDDTVTGGRGADAVHAGAGADELSPYGELNRDFGRDLLFAGAGNDRIDAADGARDRRISCGGGRDFAEYDGRTDEVGRDCEREKAIFGRVPGAD
jgi:Ca2+-binding RTX toxin-like protein